MSTCCRERASSERHVDRLASAKRRSTLHYRGLPRARIEELDAEDLYDGEADIYDADMIEELPRGGGGRVVLYSR